MKYKTLFISLFVVGFFHLEIFIPTSFSEATVDNTPSSKISENYFYITRDSDSLEGVANEIYGHENYQDKIKGWNKLSKEEELREGQELLLKEKPILDYKKSHFRIKRRGSKKIFEGPTSFPKLSTEKTNAIKVFIMKAHILYNNKEWKEAIKILRKIVKYDPTNLDAYKLMLNIFESQKKFLSIIHTYRDLLMIFHDGENIWDAKKGKISKKALSFILNIGIQYFNLYNEKDLSPKKRTYYFNQTIKHLSLCKKHNFNIFSYFFYLEQMEFKRGHHLSSFRLIKILESGEKFIPNKQLDGVIKFYKGLNFLKAGQLKSSLNSFESFSKNNDNPKISNSAKGLIQKLTSKKLSGFFGITRTVSSNPSEVSDLNRPKRSTLHGGQNIQGVFGLNYQNLQYSNSSKNYFNLEGIALITRQDLTIFQDYTNAFYSFSLSMNNYSSPWIPTSKYTYSKLLLNQEQNNGKYKIRNFSSTHNLSFSWSTATSFGVLKYKIPASITKESENKTADLFEIQNSLSFDFWKFNNYFQLLLSFDRKNLIYLEQYLPKETITQYGLGNRTKIYKLRMKTEFKYKKRRIEGVGGFEYRWSLREKFTYPLKGLYKTLSGSFSYKFERRHKLIPNQFINKGDFSLGLFMTF